MPRLAGVTAQNDLAAPIITRGQGTGVLMPEHDAAPDVILIAGQSNASGNGHPIRTATSPVDHLVQWWHTGTDPHKGTITRVEEPTAYPYDGSRGTSPGVEFARRWAAWHRRPTIVVPTAWGGTGLISAGARWQETGDLYKAAVRETKDCIAATGGRLVAIVWCQGENDAVSGVSNAAKDGYATVAARVLARMRTDLGNPTALIAVGSMVPDWVGLGQGTAQAIQDALASLPSKLTQCVHAYGGAGTGTETDGIHYSAAGTRQVGAGLWHAYRRLIDPTLPPATPPAPGISPTASGVTAWLVPSPGATGFEARWRTTGDWTTTPLTGLSVAITTPTDQLVEVQIRGTGATGTGRWSQSALTVPYLSTATLLMDASGPGTPHLSRAASQPAGARGTAVQTATDAQPIMDREDGIGDGPALIFDGSDFLSAGAPAIGDLTSGGLFTVVAVAQAAPHDGSFFGWRSGAANIGALGYTAAGQVLAQGFDDSGKVVEAKAITDMGRPHILMMDRWGGGVTLHIDGTEAASATGNAKGSGSSQLVIGAAYRESASSGILQGWRGRLAYLAVLPGVYSAAQKAPLVAYLRARFNI